MAKFLNVYNFVPFPVKKAECYKDEDRHTGSITFSITTKTPLFIPNTSNDDAFQLKCTANPNEKHISQDFYSYREMKVGVNYKEKPAMPVIPGSELRGMVRSIYETITDSCMGVLNDDQVPVIRTGAVYQAGLLVRKGTGYVLEPATNCPYRDKNDPNRKIYLSNDYTEGQKVYIKKIMKEDPKTGRKRPVAAECSQVKTKECTVVGYVVKGMSDGSFNKKKGIHVFAENAVRNGTTNE